MKRYLLHFKKLLGVFLVTGLLLGFTGPSYAETVKLQVRVNQGVNACELAINEQVVMRFRDQGENNSAVNRLNIILQRLEALLRQGKLNPEEIIIQEVNGMPVLALNGQVIATATPIDIRANNSTTKTLLQSWQNNFKNALEQSKKDVPSSIKPRPSVPQPTPNQPSKPSQSSILTADEQKMFDLVNGERIKAGLSPFKVHSELVKLARVKSQDMITNKYFAHQSPVHGSPFDMMKAAGISYTAAGENLAGASTVETAHRNLMNSPGHRANILSSNFTYVGIGIVDGGPYGKMYTQMFIKQ